MGREKRRKANQLYPQQYLRWEGQRSAWPIMKSVPKFPTSRLLLIIGTYIFDIGTRMDSNHVTVLHSEVVSNNSVDSGTAIIEIVVGEDNQNGILPLLATD